MEFDEDRLRRLASELFDALGKLKDLRALSKTSFLDDPHKVGSAKYHFIVAIEAAIDLCHHLISKNRWRTPEDYADTFQVMGEVSAFEAGFVKQLVRMAKFRNRLVHLYWEVDKEELYRILQENLRDIERFMAELARFIGRDIHKEANTDQKSPPE